MSSLFESLSSQTNKKSGSCAFRSQCELTHSRLLAHSALTTDTINQQDIWKISTMFEMRQEATCRSREHLQLFLPLKSKFSKCHYCPQYTTSRHISLECYLTKTAARTPACPLSSPQASGPPLHPFLQPRSSH